MRELGPYLLLELIMPGGTILAVSLYLYRRWTAAPGNVSAAQPLERCAAALLVTLVAFGRFCGAKQPSPCKQLKVYARIQAAPASLRC
jgi:hypothetical protein